MTDELQVAWTDDQAVPAVFIDGDRRPGVLLAHGAGVGQHHELMVAIRDTIAEAGFPVMTFDYPYMAAGRKAPDRPPKLLTCHRAAAVELRDRVGGRIVLAGRSMGGRMASHLAAEDEPCEGLILFSYPLHPPGRPEKLRVEHLPSITVPVLSLTGTRDAFVTRELYDEHLGSMPNVTTHWLEDADHSYRARKKVTGRTKDEVVAEMLGVTVEWLSRLSV